MNIMIRPVSLAVVSACFAASASAAETKSSLDAVPAKWEAATAKIKTLDAKVYLWRYDRVFSSPNQDSEPDEGRFYYERPNTGCLKWTKTVSGSGRMRPSAFAWREKDTLEIDSYALCCTHIVWPEMPAETSRDILDAELPSSFFAALAANLYLLRDPRNTIPLSVDVHVSEIQKHFNLSLEERRDQFLITAIPIMSPKKVWYSKIDVLVDRKTYLTTAVRLSEPSNNNQTVWMLEDMKINERPRDRDQLLSPDLHGLAVHEIK